MRGKRFSIGLRAALAIFTVTVLVTSTWAATNWHEEVLHSFGNGTDGAGPLLGSLIFDTAGNLYGTTLVGGTYGAGTVFELTPTAGGGWTEQVLYSFKGYPTDGAEPWAGLIFNVAGNLYGTTSGGGAYGGGTAFELTPTAGGGWTELVLHNFGYQPDGDGDTPYAGLILDAAGNLYGTTFQGGSGNRNKCTYGCGIVFELTPTAGGGWTEKVLHSFGDGTDGYEPAADRCLIFDAAGNLYGTTLLGGTYYGGTVFELTPTGGGGWTEQVLHSFGDGTDGYWPYAGLIFDAAGNLYGTTWGGTVFELTPTAGGGWTEQVLHSFNGADGSHPYAGVIFDAAGNLFSTTSAGGSYGYGTLFELTPSGGGWTYQVVHNFGTGNDGAAPQAGLISDVAGNLYSTTYGGGTYGYGTVFELSPVYPCARCVVSGEVEVLPAERRGGAEQDGIERP